MCIDEAKEMKSQELHAVTGAFGYSGKYIAKNLLAKDYQVITLTDSINRRNSFGDTVKAYPFNFGEPEKLIDSLRGVQVLYNTYWVRFNYKTFTYGDAVNNTKVLFQAAKEAGVERIVHVSITNPSEDSPLEYFRGKAKLERELKESGISYAILRPAVLFGKEDILINNIAWTLRHLPVFGVFGNGHSRLQPIYVNNRAELAVSEGINHKNVIINAIGPEIFTYKELVKEIGKAIGRDRPIISVSPTLGYLVSRVIRKLAKDVMITKEEIRGLMADLLYVDSPPAGNTKLSAWIKCHADSLGRRYRSEMARRRDRESEYDSL